MTIEQYIISINNRYKQGIATEHTFRGDLQLLLESLVPTIRATNEPKRQACGAPDYILTENDIPVGFIEAKDIGDRDLDGESINKEQFTRYKSSLNNIIFTDYISFHFYRDGQFVTKISIGEIHKGAIRAIASNFPAFEKLIKNFCLYIGQTIKSPKKLAEMMAHKTRLLSEIIEKALISDEENEENSSINEQMNAFKQFLIHDITNKAFADVYAQTIAYGMFSARTHDPDLGTFTRQKAYELIPKSNPFLKKLFGYIAGLEVDGRIQWIVDDLIKTFLSCNISEMFSDYGKNTKSEDPIIHFYEDFLKEYDPKVREQRGVWYTPNPVVNFIVRAVDDVLKNEFSMTDGLADISKTNIKMNTQTRDKRTVSGYKKTDLEIHKVQILDPATGTGTFICEVVKQVYDRFKNQQGIWSSYVESHLLPRLNGFELLMASYAMAHLKLDLLFSSTGYNSTSDQKFRIFLTNSLEEYHPDTDTLFAGWLSDEANAANYIKRDTPVMCVMGNPPYKGVSSNKSKWLDKLIEDYKYVDGVHFKERKHWLKNDYVKFIRYGQHLIDRNGFGILAFINPHGFLDDPTFRGMRWHLLKSFDKIYTIDLHGNAKKSEISPDGSVDENVFDIEAGVSINIFIKSGKKDRNSLGRVFHCDLFGKRDKKYKYLLENSIGSIDFAEIKPEKPYLFFVPKTNIGKETYARGFSVGEMFVNNTAGFVTANDKLNIALTKNELRDKINELLKLDDMTWRSKYRKDDSRDWTFATAKLDASKIKFERDCVKFYYRPFDTRYTIYTGNSRGLYSSPQPKIMRNFLNSTTNIGLAVCKQFKAGQTYQHVFITTTIMESAYVSNKTGEITSLLPLYNVISSNDENSTESLFAAQHNLNAKFIDTFVKSTKMNFDESDSKKPNTFSPIDIFDYIYAILNSPYYREEYKEFLQTDFPRVPFPTSKENFNCLVAVGKRLRRVHLLQDTERVLDTSYPEGGENRVDLIKYTEGKVYINNNQYFGNIPETLWNFAIGSYKPAQKWLKDRKNRSLSYEDISHYSNMINALAKSEQIMSEIDELVI